MIPNQKGNGIKRRHAGLQPETGYIYCIQWQKGFCPKGNENEYKNKINQYDDGRRNVRCIDNRLRIDRGNRETVCCAYDDHIQSGCRCTDRICFGRTNGDCDARTHAFAHTAGCNKFNTVTAKGGLYASQKLGWD